MWEFPRVRYRMPEYENHPTKTYFFIRKDYKGQFKSGRYCFRSFFWYVYDFLCFKTLERKSIGIEIEKEYIKIGLRRLEIEDIYEGKKLEKEKKIYEIEKSIYASASLFDGI
ncbi:hypothetical protein MAL07_19875 (plasmid) [Leptospira noguchii]|nr:hypothetical protein [Leptospira noguchii]UOG62640.1 hypothetical protein MAL07_19875 [Leptospira noguchii]